jgi:hypothetical protein
MQITIGDVVLVVLGLTQWVKTKLNVAGNVAELLTFGIGFVLGGAYQYTVVTPTVFGDWLAIVLVGAGMGLVPSGLYKFTGVVADRIRVAKS